jgi:uncharacterized protein YbcV (DUF1398 family)
MNDELKRVVEACVRGSLDGTLAFPQVVGRLAGAGVERYLADYSRQEITYYWPDGTSYVAAAPHDPTETGLAFSATDVAAAVGQSQRNEHTYRDFVRKTMAAGCVGYFVLIAGKHVQYFGRKGEVHAEWFPGAKQ